MNNNYIMITELPRFLGPLIGFPSSERGEQIGKERNTPSLQPSGEDNLKKVWKFNLYIKVIKPFKRPHSQQKVSQNYLKIYLKLPKNDVELPKNILL